MKNVMHVVYLQQNPPNVKICIDIIIGDHVKIL